MREVPVNFWGGVPAEAAQYHTAAATASPTQ